MPPKPTTPKRGSSSRPAVDPSDLSDAARSRLVRSDAARKRAALHYVRNGVAVPESYQYRAVEEFDRLHAEAARHGAGSSSGALVQRQRREALPEEVLEEGYDPAAFGPALEREDFIPDEALQAVVATVCKRSAAEEKELAEKRRRAEEEELAEKRRRDEEIDAIFLEMEAAEKGDFVDLVSSDED